jgi:hypothetical protein
MTKHGIGRPARQFLEPRLGVAPQGIARDHRDFKYQRWWIWAHFMVAN